MRKRMAFSTIPVFAMLLFMLIGLISPVKSAVRPGPWRPLVAVRPGPWRPLVAVRPGPWRPLVAVRPGPWRPLA
jgi:hypothetical protein